MRSWNGVSDSIRALPGCIYFSFQVAATGIRWKVNRAVMKKKRNWQKVVLPKLGRVLQRKHAFEGLAKNTVLHDSVLSIIFDLLISFAVPFALPRWFPMFSSVFWFQCEFRFSSDGETDAVRDWTVCPTVVAVSYPCFVCWCRMWAIFHDHLCLKCVHFVLVPADPGFSSMTEWLARGAFELQRQGQFPLGFGASLLF